MLDTHPCFIFPLYVLPDRPLQSTFEPRSRSTPVEPTTTSSSPLTRSSLAVPRQEASPFRSCCVCASLLKAPLYSRVCTQIPLIPLTLCSRAVVFETSWPWLVLNNLYYFICRVVL